MKEYKETKFEASRKDYLEYYKAKGHTFGTLDERGRSVRLFLEHLEESGVDRIEEVDLKAFESFKGFLYRRAERLKLNLKEVTLSGKMEAALHFLKFMKDRKDITARAILEIEEETAIKRESGIPEAFREVFNLFMEDQRRAGPPESRLEMYRYGLKGFFRYLTEERHVKSLNELKREDVKEFTGYLVDWTIKEGRHKGQPLSMSSINRNMDALKVFLTWLSRKGEYTNCFNLFSVTRRVKEGSKVSRNIFTRKELTTLFNKKAETPSEFMMKTIFVMLYSTGLRCGELLGLKLSDIEEERLFEKKEFIVYEPKTRKERIVQVGDVGLNYLRLYLEHVRSKIGRMKEGEEKQEVFVSYRERGRLWIHSVNNALKEVCVKNGIKKDLSSHCFRHSYGTHILENGAGIKEVSELLGHESIETTQNYTRLAPERLRETLLKFHPRESLGTSCGTTREPKKWV